MQDSYLRIWLLKDLKTICKTEIRVQAFKLSPPQSSNAAEPIPLTSINKNFAFSFHLMQTEKAVTNSVLEGKSYRSLKAFLTLR